MKKLMKLLILIIISLSVYIIYQKTNNTTYTITSFGDKLSLGINSYGITEYSYIDYYKDYLKNTKKNIIINRKYSNQTQTIREVLKEIKQTPNIKRTLADTDILIITLGYNDLLEGLSIIENINETKLNELIKEISANYNELLSEIRKYYHEKIIVIGYYESNKDEYYINKGIKKLNLILNSTDVEFINTYNILNNKKKYFSNPNSYYPNHYGYNAISKEIIGLGLAKK